MRQIRRAGDDSVPWRVWRAELSAALAGALGALALPPFHIVPVLFISFWVLLDLVRRCPGYRAAARLGWFFGFGLNLVGLYWITEAIMLEAVRFWWFIPIAVPALAAVMATFVSVAALVARLARAGLPRILVLAGAWVTMDLARQFIGTGFPWNPLGSVWEFPGRVGDVFIQPAAWVGVHGLTLATVLVCSAPVLGSRGWISAVAGIALWVGAGTYRLSYVQPIEDQGQPIQVELIQGNVAQGLKWDQAQRLAIFDRYLRLSRSVTAQSNPGVTRVVIWPETASPFLIAGDPAAREAIATAVDGSWSLIGAIRFDTAGQPRNSLIALKPDGTVAAEYDKWHLVPFGEYQPSWLPIGIQVVPGGGLRPGNGPQLLKIDRLPPFSPLICYEAIFSAQVTPPIGRPAWIVNITNDAWFGNSTGPRQHLAAARMRAVEEGLPLVRAANTGVSAVFDAHGREIGRLDLGVTGYLSEMLPNPLSPTIFSQLGLLVPGILAAGLVGVGFTPFTSKALANRSRSNPLIGPSLQNRRWTIF